jgi:aspartate/methionine/tyrosine aminotransferase
VITCGEGEAMVDTLLCLTDPGDEVILTDPTYAESRFMRKWKAFAEHRER